MIGKVQIDEILKHIPHRYPFLLVDGVEDGEPGKWIRVYKNVSVTEAIFTRSNAQRTFPDLLIVEAFAQCAGVLCYFSGLMKPFGQTISFFASLENCRFHQSVVAGDRIVFHCDMGRAMRGVVKLSGAATVGGDKILDVSVTAVMRDKRDLIGDVP